MRLCFREPIPEIQSAAALLSNAVDAHIAGEHELARECLRLANLPAVRDFTESLWGRRSRFVPLVAGADRPQALRVERRMPTQLQKRALHSRDGFHCRF